MSRSCTLILPWTWVNVPPEIMARELLDENMERVCKQGRSDIPSNLPINRTATPPFWNVLNPNLVQILLLASIGRIICPRNSKFIELPSYFGKQTPEPWGPQSYLIFKNFQARPRGEPPWNRPRTDRYLGNQSKSLYTSAWKARFKKMFVPTAHVPPMPPMTMRFQAIYQTRGPDAQMFVSCRNPFRARRQMFGVGIAIRNSKWPSSGLWKWILLFSTRSWLEEYDSDW